MSRELAIGQILGWAFFAGLWLEEIALSDEDVREVLTSLGVTEREIQDVKDLES